MVDGIQKSLMRALLALMALMPGVGLGEFYSIDPTYMDPTDLASGGASTTFATNEGMIFSNPALMALGPKTFRWLGTRFSLMPSTGAVDAFSTGLPEFDGDDLSGSLDKYADVDLAVGAGSTLLTFIMSNFAIVPIGMDLRVAFGFRKFGSLESQSTSYEAFVDIENKSGVAIAFAGMPTRWWSLGVTARGLLVTDQLITIPLNISAIAINPDAAAAAINSAISNAAETASNKQVIGYDVGNLFFFQGDTIDFRLATVVRDVGGATITDAAASVVGGAGGSGGSEGASLEIGANEKPQAIDVGVGLTFHTNDSFIHFAADVKDYQNVYGEPDFKRYAFGVKSHLYKWVALGAGVRHGYATMGVEADLVLFRLSASKYSEVIGSDPAGRKRDFYHVSLAFGTDF